MAVLTIQGLSQGPNFSQGSPNGHAGMGARQLTGKGPALRQGAFGKEPAKVTWSPETATGHHHRRIPVQPAHQSTGKAGGHGSKHQKEKDLC